MSNVKAMLQIVTQKYLIDTPSIGDKASKLAVLESFSIPKLEVTPDVGLLHPLLIDGNGVMIYALNPKKC